MGTAAGGRAETSLFARSRKRRPGRELSVAFVFGPLAHAAVVVLRPLRAPPPAVVLMNAAAGVAGAVAVGRGSLLAGALLLQLKTVLDNADGQLARATGRTTLVGRYLDTLADLAVNVAVFAALGAATGRWWLALASLVALTIVLSVDHNLEALHRRAHGEEAPAPDEAGASWALVPLERAYATVFAPQDRLVRRGSEARFARLAEGARPSARTRAAAAYHDSATVTVLANMGLSTQLAALGICLALGVPVAYLWLSLACLAALPALQLRRERLARRALVAAP